VSWLSTRLWPGAFCTSSTWHAGSRSNRVLRSCRSLNGKHSIARFTAPATSPMRRQICRWRYSGLPDWVGSWLAKVTVHGCEGPLAGIPQTTRACSHVGSAQIKQLTFVGAKMLDRYFVLGYPASCSKPRR